MAPLRSSYNYGLTIFPAAALATALLAFEESLATIKAVTTDKRALSIGRVGLALCRRHGSNIIVNRRPGSDNCGAWVERDREFDRRASRALWR